MVGWFEIPVIDMDRAKAFYDAVFNIQITVQDFGGALMGLFPYAEGQSGAVGFLIRSDTYQPSDSKGVLIYFSSIDTDSELN